MSYRVLFPGPFRENNILFEIRPGRKNYPPEWGEMIVSAWEDAKSSHERIMFDGVVWSLLEARSEADRLICLIQETGYREYFGTNVCNRDKISNPDIMGNALAACCIVETADRRVAVGLRSSAVAEDAGCWHIPAGSLEVLDPDGNPAYDTIRQELFEELGLASKRIQGLTCLGLARNMISYRPEFVFCCLVNLNSAEIAVLAGGARDAHEHSELRFVPVCELRAFVRDQPFSVIGRCAVEMFSDLYPKGLSYGKKAGRSW